jgi:hypothetical protein
MKMQIPNPNPNPNPNPSALKHVTAEVLAEFFAYVGAWYGQEGLYPDFFVPPASHAEIIAATAELLVNYALTFEPGVVDVTFDAGSFEREVVRDIMWRERGRPLSELEHGGLLAISEWLPVASAEAAE